MSSSSSGAPDGSSSFLLGVEDGVARLVLNRPSVLNALSSELIASLCSTLEVLAADDSVRVLILTGAGRAFCVGADLRDPMMAVDLPAQQRGVRFLATADNSIHALARRLHHFGKPVVAAVNGPAVGGGAALAFGAHIAVAARSAYFQQPFSAQLGLVPDMGASWYLMRRAGPARAMALTLLGERLDAETAAQWGLIWQCVDDDALQETVGSIARRLAASAPRAMKALPHVMWRALVQDLDAQLDLERDTQAELVQTEDFIEAVTAFKEKRPPRFTGR